MDMTNFIKGNTIKSKSAIMNSPSSQEASPSTSNKVNNKYNNHASMDSINAVERELDEVLKDLELNSQDLSDQLNENVYQQHNHINNNSSIELPINIQKSGNQYKIDTATSSSSSPISINRWNNNQTKKANNGSEFINMKQTDIFINENYDQKKSMNTNPMTAEEKKQQMAMRKRQNIISTYELCNDCYENSGVLQSNGEVSGTCQHHSNGSNNGSSSHTKLIAPKNQKSNIG